MWRMFRSCVVVSVSLLLPVGIFGPGLSGQAHANDPARLGTLTTDLATDLVKQGKPLRLAVTELAADVAAILAGAKGELRFEALTGIAPAAAAAVAKMEGSLQFPRLAALTPAVAEALAGHAGELHLSGVKELPPDVAAALAPHAGLLVLGVTELSADAAAALAKHVGDLRLDSLASLTSLPLAERIGKQTVVPLASVRRISPEIARALNPPVDLSDKNLGYRWIDIGLTELSPEAGAAVLASRHGFSMHSLESIAPDAAAAMQGGPFINMRIWGLKMISPATATALANGSGFLDIRTFGPELPADTAAAFAAQMARQPCRMVDLNGLKKLSSPALAVAALRREGHGQHSQLGGVAEITDDVARALADSKDRISGLPSLTSLTSAALAAKYAAQGDVSFKKITTIPDDVAAALATCKGRIDLSGLRSLSVAAAAAFAAHEGPLVLDGLDELGDESATALAKAVGPVSLKRLTKLSPAARGALGSNPRIRLPPPATP